MVIDFATENRGASLSDNQKQFAIFCLRAELLRTLLGVPSFRDYSKTLASSDLLADFCRIRELDGIRWSSKSTLERASKMFTDEQLRRLHELLVKICGNGDCCDNVGLEKPVDVGICLIDSTCLEANIHFPVDWVLLKDVAMTLLKAIVVIRNQSVKNRMQQGPKVLMRAMNQLCIEMTHSRRRADSKKQRKGVFREMKRLLNCVAAHARAHWEKLVEQSSNTELSLPRFWESSCA